MQQKWWCKQHLPSYLFLSETEEIILLLKKKLSKHEWARNPLKNQRIEDCINIQEKTEIKEDIIQQAPKLSLSLE